MLFTLRGVDHEELIAVDADAAISATITSGKSKTLAASELSDVFGIDLDSGHHTDPIAESTTAKRKRTTRKPITKKATKKLSVKQRKNRGEIPKNAAKKTPVKQVKNRCESGEVNRWNAPLINSGRTAGK